MTQALSDAPFTVAALYRFTRFDDPAAIKPGLDAVCAAHGLCGTLLLAGEGINGTIAGSAEGIAAAIAHIRGLPGCEALDVKYSTAMSRPFLRMKVRLKSEIVTMGVAEIDAARDKGDYVTPDRWNALIADPDTVLIDTRNDYEVAVGSFAGAINPGTDSFRDFPGWFAEHSDEWRRQGKAVAMFCTGGIRCEKATAYVRAQGFDRVYHLQGGILKYLEEVPAEDSRFEGDCFVFDQRVAVSHGLGQSDYALCHGCRHPVSPADRASPAYREGVSCPHCEADRGEDRRRRYGERQRQVELAREAGRTHLGSVLPQETAAP